MFLEVRAVLMRLEGGFIAEQLVKQELCRILLRAADQEQFYSGLALRLRDKVPQDLGDPVRLSLPGFPLRHDQKTLATDRLIDGSLVHCLLAHGGTPFRVGPDRRVASRRFRRQFGNYRNLDANDSMMIEVR